MSLTPADLSRIEALAKAATPGARLTNGVYRCVQTHDVAVPLAAVCYYGNTPRAEPDSDLIAALDPDTVLALVEAAQEARYVALRWANESPYLPPEDSPDYAAALEAEADKILNYSCPSGCCRNPRCDSIAL